MSKEYQNNVNYENSNLDRRIKQNYQAEYKYNHANVLANRIKSSKIIPYKINWQHLNREL